MKVKVLIGMNNIDVRDEQDNVFHSYEDKFVLGLYQTEGDAKHNGWCHRNGIHKPSCDDWEIEEFDL